MIEEREVADPHLAEDVTGLGVAHAVPRRDAARGVAQVVDAEFVGLALEQIEARGVDTFAVVVIAVAVANGFGRLPMGRGTFPPFRVGWRGSRRRTRTRRGRRDKRRFHRGLRGVEAPGGDAEAADGARHSHLSSRREEWRGRMDFWSRRKTPPPHTITTAPPPRAVVCYLRDFMIIRYSYNQSGILFVSAKRVEYL